MSKDAVTDWSTTAASNTDVAGINIDENCAPSGLNNALRAVMAQVATALATWKVGDGSVSAPSYTFTADTNTGIYRIGADNIGVTIGGTKRLDIASTGLSVTGGVTASGTVTGASAVVYASGNVLPSIGTSTSSAAAWVYRQSGADVWQVGVGAGDGTADFNIYSSTGSNIMFKLQADGTFAIESRTLVDGNGDIPFARISTNAVGALPKRFTSSAQTITAGSSGNLTLAHSLGATPFDVTLWLVAQASPELGYTEGDKVKINTNDSGSSGQNAGVAILADSTNVYVYPGTEIGIVIPHKSTNTLTGIDTSKWKFEVRAWV